MNPYTNHINFASRCLPGNKNDAETRIFTRVFVFMLLCVGIGYGFGYNI